MEASFALDQGQSYRMYTTKVQTHGIIRKLRPPIAYIKAADIVRYIFVRCQQWRDWLRTGIPGVIMFATMPQDRRRRHWMID